MYFATSHQSSDKVLPDNRFTQMSGSKKFSLLKEQSTSSGVALIMQSFSVLVVWPVEPLLEVQELQVQFEDMQRDSVTVKDSLLSDLESVSCIPGSGLQSRTRSLTVRAAAIEATAHCAWHCCPSLLLVASMALHERITVTSRSLPTLRHRLLYSFFFGACGEWTFGAGLCRRLVDS